MSLAVVNTRVAEIIIINLRLTYRSRKMRQIFPKHVVRVIITAATAKFEITERLHLAGPRDGSRKARVGRYVPYCSLKRMIRML